MISGGAARWAGKSVTGSRVCALASSPTSARSGFSVAALLTSEGVCADADIGRNTCTGGPRMTSDAPDRPPPRIDSSVAHSARVWNYWLGGKDYYEVDRVVAGEIAQVFPGMVDIARQARQFLFRAVRYLAVEADVRQFLDIGTGLPVANNTHEIAQGLAPESPVAYVVNEPLVLVHGT